MKTVSRVALAILAIGLLGGCSMASGARSGRFGLSMPQTPVQPPPGYLYERVQAPLTYNYHATPAESAKTGRATSRFLSIPFTYGLLSFAWDDCSLEQAAKLGGLSQVDYADYEIFNVLGIYSELSVIAHGK